MGQPGISPEQSQEKKLFDLYTSTAVRGRRFVFLGAHNEELCTSTGRFFFSRVLVTDKVLIEASPWVKHKDGNKKKID